MCPRLFEPWLCKKNVEQKSDLIHIYHNRRDMDNFELMNLNVFAGEWVTTSCDWIFHRKNPIWTRTRSVRHIRNSRRSSTRCASVILTSRRRPFRASRWPYTNVRPSSRNIAGTVHLWRRKIKILTLVRFLKEVNNFCSHCKVEHYPFYKHNTTRIFGELQAIPMKCFLIGEEK